MKLSTKLLLTLALLPGSARAGAYIAQDSFAVPAETVAGLGTDAVGNVYLLGLAPGAATYGVWAYRAHSLNALGSFEIAVTDPIAFAVEPSGMIDVLDGAAGRFTLRRFQNTGTAAGVTSIPFDASSVNFVRTALDRFNGRVYLAYQYTYSPIYPACLGCGGPSRVTRANINQYDLNGSLLSSVSMPGADYTGGCYTPTRLTAGPGGELFVADSWCGQVLKYSASQSLINTFSASGWGSGLDPRAMWTDPASSLYLSQLVCGSAGCQQGILKISGDGTLQTSFAADAPSGCAWDSRILYLSSSGRSPIRRFVFASPLSVPAETDPIGAVVRHSSAVVLNWQDSSSAEGDPILYTVLLGTAPAGLRAAGTASQASFTTVPLVFGATYHWQITAQASYLGLPLQTVQAPVVSFSAALKNDPPAAFAVTGGTGTVTTRAASVALSWQAARDADGDPVVYDVLWRGPGDAQMSAIGSTRETEWIVGGLAFGATYYWSVLASDVYGSSTSLNGGLEQPYRAVFANSRPPLPAVLSGAGVTAQHTWSPQATLSWSPVDDPDGDAVSYQLAFGTAPSALAYVQEGSATSYGPLVLGTGATYYWQVSAYDPYGGASTTAVQSLRPVMQNQAPAAFAVLSGTSTALSRDSARLLAWAAAQDGDGDQVAYQLAVGTSPASLDMVSDGLATSYSAEIAFGTTYYWQVTARDGFGGSRASAVQSFATFFRNSPPSAPANLSKTGAVPFHGLVARHVLDWKPSADPDGDAVTYEVSLGTASDALKPAAGMNAGDAADLALGTTYFYKIAAVDAFGAVSSASLQSVLYQFANTAPAPVQYLAPSSLRSRATSYLLAWTGSSDPESDELSYRFEAGSSSSSLSLAQVGPSPSYALPLQYGTTVYYRVTAVDAFGAATPGPVASLSAIFLNDPPEAPDVIGPFKQSPVVKTMRNSVSVTWQQVTTPQNDPITYTVYFGDSPADMQLLATIQARPAGPAAVLHPSRLAPRGQVQANDDSVTLSLDGLEFYRRYYFRVAASNPYGATTMTPMQSFTLAAADGFPKAYNYPNPFSPSRGGTRLVFNSPSSGHSRAVVEVFSEFQDLLFRRELSAIPSGVSEVAFEGRDRYGRPLYNGSYVCRVRFFGPDDEQTFYLMVVK